MTEQIKTEVVTVTPALAKQWLSNQIENNRRPSANHVEALARSIANGYWRLNGEAIKINTGGRMMDGQHRCLAVIKANRSIQTLVVHGLTEDEFPTLDGRGARRVRDFLTCPNASSVASVAAYVLHYIVEGKTFGTTRKSRLTPPEGIKIIESYPEIVEAVSWTRSGHGALALSSGIAFVLWYYGFCSPSADREKAYEFCVLLHSGAGMEPDHPAFRFREKMIEWKGKGIRFESERKMLYAVKAYRAFRDGKKMKRLSIADGESITLD